MTVQAGSARAMIKTDMQTEVDGYASSISAHSAVLKMSATMEARKHLAMNAAPLLTCEALMCELARKNAAFSALAMVSTTP